jgi:hypothetical protein
MLMEQYWRCLLVLLFRQSIDSVARQTTKVLRGDPPRKKIVLSSERINMYDLPLLVWSNRTAFVEIVEVVIV